MLVGQREQYKENDGDDVMWRTLYSCIHTALRQHSSEKSIVVEGESANEDQSTFETSALALHSRRHTSTASGGAWPVAGLSNIGGLHLFSKHIIPIEDSPLYSVRVARQTVSPVSLSVTVLRRVCGQIFAQNSAYQVDFKNLVTTLKLEVGDKLFYFPTNQSRFDALPLNLPDIAGAIAVMNADTTSPYITFYVAKDAKDVNAIPYETRGIYYESSLSRPSFANRLLQLLSAKPIVRTSY